MARRLLGVLQLDAAVTAPRQAWGAEVAALIAAAVRKWRRDELLAALARTDVWAEAACPNGEMQNLRDEDLQRLGTVVATRHPQFGEVRQIGRLVRLAAAPLGPSARHAPLPGEHTDELLGELGVAAATIRDLRERRIVK
jgi:crotonobetainyl-CoA:carnitine CoA-transferase CaiB-like acyl-CoA transferase